MVEYLGTRLKEFGIWGGNQQEPGSFSGWREKMKRERRTPFSEGSEVMREKQ